MDGVIHAEGDLVAAVEQAQIFQGVAAQLGERGGGLGLRPLLADDQLTGAQVDVFLVEQVTEGHGTEHRRGQQAGLAVVEIGHQLGAVGGDGRDSLQALAAQASDALGHGHGELTSNLDGEIETA